MSEKQMKNLDVSCAELGRQLANSSDIEEKTLNAALTVLEEQGPYAMFLYLKAKHKKVAEKVSNDSLAFLKDVFPGKLNGVNEILEAVKRLAEHLDDLLFARDLLLRVLSYARYHLKAKEASTP